MSAPLRIGLPKGRMQDGVLQLLGEAGIDVKIGTRGYRPHISLPDTEAKLLKPQNIVEMLHHGSRDVGFCGADWVSELGAELELVLDLALDPVKVVAAAPAQYARDPAFLTRPLVVVSEYEQLTRRWIQQRGLKAEFVRSYGATEAFPPEDADLIVDNTATGSTLQAHDLAIVDELMRSSTRLYASPKALADIGRRAAIDDLVLLLQSVLEARRRVMVEINVEPNALEAVIAVLPCMRQPTVARLHGDAGYAVKAAVPKDKLPQILLQIRARGGTDIVVSPMTQLVP
jgi:ATP phosphoribosyltransferase